jgi:hypothetical protein
MVQTHFLVAPRRREISALSRNFWYTFLGHLGWTRAGDRAILYTGGHGFWRIFLKA